MLSCQDIHHLNQEMRHATDVFALSASHTSFLPSSLLIVTLRDADIKGFPFGDNAVTCKWRFGPIGLRALTETSAIHTWSTNKLSSISTTQNSPSPYWVRQQNWLFDPTYVFGALPRMLIPQQRLLHRVIIAPRRNTYASGVVVNQKKKPKDAQLGFMNQQAGDHKIIRSLPHPPSPRYSVPASLTCRNCQCKANVFLTEVKESPHFAEVGEKLLARANDAQTLLSS